MVFDLPPEEYRALMVPMLQSVAAQLGADLVKMAELERDDRTKGYMDKDGAALHLHIEVRALENWMKPVSDGGRALPHFKFGTNVRFLRSRIYLWALTQEVNAPIVALEDAA